MGTMMGTISHKGTFAKIARARAEPVLLEKTYNISGTTHDMFLHSSS